MSGASTDMSVTDANVIRGPPALAVHKGEGGSSLKGHTSFLFHFFKLSILGAFSRLKQSVKLNLGKKKKKKKGLLYMSIIISHSQVHN